MQFMPPAADVVAVVILAFPLYFRRYYRRDLPLAYVALNVGVLVVTWVLVSSDVGVGLGLGLFGALSIIRLRSDSVTHEEIAYYFAALAFGLLGGVRAAPLWVGPALSAVLLLVMYVVDHPRLFSRVRRQIVTLDAAYTDERLVWEALGRLLGGQPRHVVVVEIDLVRDITKVDVRYRVAGHRFPMRRDRVAP